MFIHKCNTCGVEYSTKNNKTKGRCRACAMADPKRSEKIKNSWRNKPKDEIKQVVENRKRTCIEKYGVEYVSQAEEIKAKSRQTCIEKYGVDNVRKSDYFKNKMLNYWMDNYGVENPAQAPHIRQKISDSLHSSDFDRVEFMHERIRQMDEQGIERIGSVPKASTIETNLRKYGSEYYFQSEYGKMSKENLMNTHGWTEDEYNEFKNKRIHTLENFVKRYGDMDGPIKYGEYLNKLKHTEENFIRRHGQEEGTLRYKEYIKKKYRKSEWNGRASKESLKFFLPLYKKLRKLGIPRSDFYIGVSGSKEYFSWDLKYKLMYLYDFVIKSLKICIEYNGVTWHPKPNLSENKQKEWKRPYSDITYLEAIEYDNRKLEVIGMNGFKVFVVWSDDNLQEKSNEIFNYIFNLKETEE